ncbi:hypothetical protein V6N12_026220 [Hibiscus sabdariffa]|uniref:Uncharacterized protein n=3 Tax=Hibiscus sabdariffa TaxID=183260 RepID=A0ABR2DR53_9ROSI
MILILGSGKWEWNGTNTGKDPRNGVLLSQPLLFFSLLVKQSKQRTTTHGLGFESPTPTNPFHPTLHVSSSHPSILSPLHRVPPIKGHPPTQTRQTALQTKLISVPAACSDTATHQERQTDMAGNKHKKSFSFFSFFKAKKGRREQDYYSGGEDVWGTRKVYPSDEDNTLRVVAEPGIDKKASAFIANFHATRVSEAIHHQQAG